MVVNIKLLGTSASKTYLFTLKNAKSYKDLVDLPQEAF